MFALGLVGVGVATAVADDAAVAAGATGAGECLGGEAVQLTAGATVTGATITTQTLDVLLGKVLGLYGQLCEVTYRLSRNVLPWLLVPLCNHE